MNSPFLPKSIAALFLAFHAGTAITAELQIVSDVELQPLASHARRVIEALDYVGAPLSGADKSALEAALQNSDPKKTIPAIQQILDRYCLAGIHINELSFAQPEAVKVSARVAAFLNEKPDRELRKRGYEQKPYWDVERARIAETRDVPVELIVNGFPVARKNITADGKLRDVEFDVQIDRSSWIALRILPSSHSNPVFVMVDGKPIRASRRSVEWCLKGVDQCWTSKQRFIKESEWRTPKPPTPTPATRIANC